MASPPAWCGWSLEKNMETTCVPSRCQNEEQAGGSGFMAEITKNEFLFSYICSFLGFESTPPPSSLSGSRKKWSSSVEICKKKNRGPSVINPCRGMPRFLPELLSKGSHGVRAQAAWSSRGGWAPRTTINILLQLYVIHTRASAIA